MLTVRYDQLGLQPGDLVLDLGCGFGRHAFEAARRGATVVAFDYADTELKEVLNTFGAMAVAGEVTESSCAGAVQGDGTQLPFAAGVFDRLIAAEVLEHVPDDERAIAELVRVLKPGGTMAVTVPAWLPERINWALSEEYHAPFVTGGHVRVYGPGEMAAKLHRAGVRVSGSHRAHALHSPYWWLRCAVGPADETNVLVRKYKQFLEWDIVAAPRITRAADRVLNPVLGKSLVVYASKP
jgi:SAM-dependent methyltransferase